MIDRVVIDNIVETANAQIVEVISDFVSLRRRGSNYICCCPFHNEKTPSFNVSPGRGMYKCFGCGKAGGALKFVMEYNNMTFVEAIKYLGNKFNIEVPEMEETPEMAQLRNERESLMSVADFARNTFQKNLWETDEGARVALPYLRQTLRLRDDVIKKFELGYGLKSTNAFTSQALQYGFKQEYLWKSGLTDGSMNDTFCGRLTFPIHNAAGKPIAFVGMALQQAENLPTYIITPENELYQKERTIYGIHIAKNEIVKQERCFLVNSYTDAILMHQIGITNVVASENGALTDGQITQIRRFTSNVSIIVGKESVATAFDNIDMILSRGLTVKILLLPEGETLSSYIYKNAAENVATYIDEEQTDFVIFKAMMLMDKVQSGSLDMPSAISGVIASIASIGDGILREIYIQECSRILQISEQSLTDALNSY